MKPIHFLFIFFLSCSLQVFAQQSDNPPITEHSKAIQFQINNNFTLGSFQGAAFSYKHHVEPSFAYRIGISLSLNNETSDNTQQSFNAQALSSSNSTTQKENAIYTQLNIQALWYSASPTGAHFFYGTGPFISHGWSQNNIEQVNSLQQEIITEETYNSWSFGFTGVAGVEYFVAQSISIHAEYGISLGYSWSKNESTVDNSSGLNVSTFETTKKS